MSILITPDCVYYYDLSGEVIRGDCLCSHTGAKVSQVLYPKKIISSGIILPGALVDDLC